MRPRTLLAAVVAFAAAMLALVPLAPGPAHGLAGRDPQVISYTASFSATHIYNWKATHSDTEFDRRVLELNVDGVIAGIRFVDGELLSSRDGTNLFRNVGSFTESVTDGGSVRTYCPDDDDVRDPSGLEPALRRSADGTPLFQAAYFMSSRLTCTTTEDGTVTHGPDPGKLDVPGVAVPMLQIPPRVGAAHFTIEFSYTLPKAQCPGVNEGDVTYCYYNVAGTMDFTRDDVPSPYDPPAQPTVQKKGKRATVQVGCQVDCAVQVEARPRRGGKPFATTRGRLAAGESGLATLGLSAAEARRVRRDGGLRLVVSYTSEDADPETVDVVARL